MKDMLDIPPDVAAGAAEPTASNYPPIERGRASFDPRALQRVLDGEHQDIRNSIRELVSRPEFRYFEGTDHRAYRKQVLAWCKRVADTGIGRLFMPKYIGGEENLQRFMAAFETLAFHDSSLVIKLGVQFGLFAGSIQRLGTEYHHRKYLADAAAARVMGCFAMTEIGHGSNVQALETTAIYEAETDSFVINSPTFSSSKTFIGNAGADGRLAIVFAQLEIDDVRYGVHAFVVPIRNEKGEPLPGVILEDNGLKMGLNGVDNGRIGFDHVRVPREEMLNRFAEVTPGGGYRSEIQNPSARFFTMIGTLVSGRISIAASGNGVAKSALAIAIRYAARRRQFGPPKAGQETLLLDFPAHQRRLMPLLASAYALDFALKHLGRLNETGRPDDSRMLETLAAGIKAFTTWNTTRTIQVCREACGGEGYLSVNRFAALKADSDIYTTFEGDNTVLMQLVAKNLLSDFKDKLREMKPAQITGFFLDQTMSALAKRNPVLTLNHSSAHLRDPAFQLMMFRFRENSLLFECGQEFRRLTGARKLDPFSTFTAMQNSLLELAHASVERVVVEQFAAVVRDLDDRSVKPVLKRLCDLFALFHLELHKGWHLEHGSLSSGKSRAITSEVDRLCAETRQEVVALVDAFGIPEACLAAPIAL
jgi:acyl-CoA oxidase